MMLITVCVWGGGGDENRCIYIQILKDCSRFAELQSLEQLNTNKFYDVFCAWLRSPSSALQFEYVHARATVTNWDYPTQDESNRYQSPYYETIILTITTKD